MIYAGFFDDYLCTYTHVLFWFLFSDARFFTCTFVDSCTTYCFTPSLFPSVPCYFSPLGFFGVLEVLTRAEMVGTPAAPSIVLLLIWSIVL